MDTVKQEAVALAACESSGLKDRIYKLAADAYAQGWKDSWNETLMLKKAISDQAKAKSAETTAPSTP
jgi:hypothetical protein